MNTSPKKIVIAEDDSSLLLLLKFRFEEAGYQIYEANDGEEALSLVNLHAPDLLISDIMMPKLNGIEVVEKVRETDKKTPIILLSNAGQEEMVMSSFHIGATDFLSKPFIINELLIRVKRILQQPA